MNPKDERFFGDEFIYQCSECGAWLPQWVHDKNYDKKTDTVTCHKCDAKLRVGGGIRDSDPDNDPGDLDGSLFFVCPECHSSINEDNMPRGEGEDEGLLICPACGFKGRHEGGLE